MCIANAVTGHSSQEDISRGVYRGDATPKRYSAHSLDSVPVGPHDSPGAPRSYSTLPNRGGKGWHDSFPLTFHWILSQFDNLYIDVISLGSELFFCKIFHRLTYSIEIISN